MAALDVSVIKDNWVYDISESTCMATAGEATKVMTLRPFC